ncbi:MAG: glutaredoxin family protein [Gammaproteobacteria bacterium]|nr:glutaredoxin family protein [Gammaproteobacteria bacterium]
MNTTNLVLYSTDHCTLCEQALELLFSMPELQGCSLRVIDVATDPALTELYGERLPVLRSGDAELDWPFDANTVRGVIGV